MDNLPKIRFALSNLHWGTRWSLYDKIQVNCPKILIDGDDDLNIGNWKAKYEWHCSRYPVDPPESIKSLLQSPYRWMESLGNYEPDIVFCAHKSFSDQSSVYIPFGIHKQYYKLSTAKAIQNRQYTFAHFPGPGILRRKTEKTLRMYNRLFNPKPPIWNESIRDDNRGPEEVQEIINKDKNVHSWHRWTMSGGYFKILNESRILIYPGIDHWPFWDSKRPWEAIASGAAVLMQKPRIDTQGIGLDTIDTDFVFDGRYQLIRKIRQLQRLSKDQLAIKIQNFVSTAQEQFSSVSIASYFLKIIG